MILRRVIQHIKHQAWTAIGANARLLATAQNYWLYTNRHLKLIGELCGDAERLAGHLEAGNGGNR